MVHNIKCGMVHNIIVNKSGNGDFSRMVHNIKCGMVHNIKCGMMHNIIVNKSGNGDFSRMGLIKQTQGHREGCSLDPSRSWPCFGGPATPSYPPPWLLQQLFPKPPLAFSQQCSISP